MFVEVHVTLPVCADRATDAVESALADHALQERTSDAVAEGLELALDVGPRPGNGFLSKQVVARTLPRRHVGATTVIPLRWEATGVTSRLYPALDANIGITAVDETTCLLSLVGAYTPPLGAVGTTIDRAAMARVATATVESFLHRLAHEALDDAVLT